MTIRRRAHSGVLVALLALAAMGAGCSSARPISQGAGYPAGVRQGETLDIQVRREGTHIELTNTTARVFGPSRLWINRAYSLELPGLGPGESRRLALREFRDVYGESFRAGGFFAIERPERVAVAELETAGAPAEDGGPTRVLLPMVVVGEWEG